MEHWEAITLQTFSGPLDLLLSLIRNKKLSLKDISVLMVTDQYLQYLQTQQKLDIEIASEYLTMAAQLIEMKSLYLLPSADGPNRDDIYVDLVEQLNHFDQIKKVAGILNDKQEEYRETLSKPLTKPTKPTDEMLINNANSLNNQEPEIDLGNLDLSTFANIYRSLLDQMNQVNDDTIDYDWQDDSAPESIIETAAIPPQEMAKMIISCMLQNKLKAWTLAELLPAQTLNWKNLIMTFLAVLDLVRYQFMKITQQGDIIWVRLTPSAIEEPDLLARLEMISYDNQEIEK